MFRSLVLAPVLYVVLGSDGQPTFSGSFLDDPADRGTVTSVWTSEQPLRLSVLGPLGFHPRELLEVTDRIHPYWTTFDWGAAEDWYLIDPVSWSHMRSNPAWSRLDELDVGVPRKDVTAVVCDQVTKTTIGMEQEIKVECFQDDCNIPDTQECLLVSKKRTIGNITVEVFFCDCLPLPVPPVITEPMNCHARTTILSLGNDIVGFRFKCTGRFCPKGTVCKKREVIIDDEVIRACLCQAP